MGRQFAYLMVGLALLAAPAQAVQPAKPDPIALSFAVCAGRFAALANSARHRAQSDRDMRDSYNQFVTLLEAIAPPPGDGSAPARELRAIRAASRIETAHLLDVALYGQDPRRIRLARAALDARIRSCDTLTG